MSALARRWRPEQLSAEARRLAEAAAREAGLSLKLWLALTIREISAAEHVPPPASPSSAAAKALALLAETLKRGNVPPLDEARAYLRLVSEFQVRTDEIAAAVGHPPERIDRALRLLKLPQKVRDLIEQRGVSAERVYALLDAPNTESLAHAVRDLGLAADATRGRLSPESPPTAKGND